METVVSGADQPTEPGSFFTIFHAMEDPVTDTDGEPAESEAAFAPLPVLTPPPQALQFYLFGITSVEPPEEASAPAQVTIEAPQTEATEAVAAPAVQRAVNAEVAMDPLVFELGIVEASVEDSTMTSADDSGMAPEPSLPPQDVLEGKMNSKGIEPGREDPSEPQVPEASEEAGRAEPESHEAPSRSASVFQRESMHSGPSGSRETAPAREPPIVKEVQVVKEAPKPVEPPRLAVRIAAENGSKPPVDVVFAQRGPGLHFSVHSADRGLGSEMRASLGELTERLEGLGFRTLPLRSTEPAEAVRETYQAEGRWTGEGRSGSGTGDGGKRQGRRDRGRWRSEIENQFALPSAGRTE
jgi:hypothetical protein